MKLFSFTVALATLAADVLAIFNNDRIEKLTSANWDEKVGRDNDNAWVVTYYADWCPYCKDFSPEYEAALADPLLQDKRIRFGAVDVMANRDLVTKHGIKRSPSVKVYGTDKANGVDYLGQRKSADLVTYCNGYCNDNAYLRAPPLPKATYFYNVDDIVNQIIGAHEKRVADSQYDVQLSQHGIQDTLNNEYARIEKETDDKIRALYVERNNQFQQAELDVYEDVRLAQKAHEGNERQWEVETSKIIDELYSKDAEGVELSVWIEKLDLPWLAVQWGHNNRQPKEPVATKTSAAAKVSAAITPAVGYGGALGGYGGALGGYGSGYGSGYGAYAPNYGGSYGAYW